MDNNVPPVYASNPPVITPQPPPPRKSRGWMILALALAAVLLVLVAGQFMQAISGMAGINPMPSSGTGHLEEMTVENNHSENKIVVVPVEGIISSQIWDRGGRNMVESIAHQLKIAGRDKSVRAVILKVDSPGGEVMASDDISRAISEFQQEYRKPVVAFLSGLAASGGYYVAVPCQWIVANELTITGSIGVIMHSFNYRGLMDKVGVHPQVFKSGRFKDMLSGSRKLEDIDPKEAQMIQAMIEETYDRFKTVVREGRGRSLSKNQGDGKPLVEGWEQYADGRVLTGRQAFEYGFVDEKGHFEDTVARAKRIANIPDANLVRYEEPFRLSRIFGFLGKSANATLKVDLGLDLPKLQAGRLYFLSSTVLH